MAYDRFTASMRLLESGSTAGPGRLSRRRRVAAVAYDVRADLAATWFVRRGHPVLQHEIDLFVRQDGHWRPLCGGGFGDGDDHLSDRPGTDVLGAPLVTGGSGGIIPPDAPDPAPDVCPAPVVTPCGYTTLRRPGPSCASRSTTAATPRRYHGTAT